MAGGFAGTRAERLNGEVRMREPLRDDDSTRGAMA
jgi:hypothetical protein